MAVMRRFLADFPSGLREGRYRAQALPHLDFRDGAFDLTLCSHFLFTYSGQLTLDFHLASIEEMCRVAGEARVFPLLQRYGAETRCSRWRGSRDYPESLSTASST
jgi:hypothetical protein